MNKSSIFKLAIPIYALIIAFIKLASSLAFMRNVFQHASRYTVPNSDVIIAAVLIIAAVGVIRKTRWAGSLYIFSMGMIMPQLIATFSNMIGMSYYIYSGITIVLIILGVLFAVKVRSVVEN
jgi:hypothetical protein